MWSVAFWKQVVERALKGFVHSLVATVLASGAVTLTGAPWSQALNIAALAGVLSVLTSVLSGLKSTDGGELKSPSLVSVLPKDATPS